MVSDPKETQRRIPAEEAATTDEIIAAIESLSEVQLYKMEKFARYRIRGLGRRAGGRDHEDLLREAMTATLTGTRRWNRTKVEFFTHLAGAMRSISSHWKESFSPNEAYLESELSHEPDRPSILLQRPSAAPDAERILAARQELKQIESRFADDPTVPLILNGFREGLSGPEIQMANGLSKNDYESALKRLRRWVAAEREGASL